MGKTKRWKCRSMEIAQSRAGTPGDRVPYLASGDPVFRPFACASTYPKSLQLFGLMRGLITQNSRASRGENADGYLESGGGSKKETLLPAGEKVPERRMRGRSSRWKTMLMFITQRPLICRCATSSPQGEKGIANCTFGLKFKTADRILAARCVRGVP